MTADELQINPEAKRSVEISREKIAKEQEALKIKYLNGKFPYEEYYDDRVASNDSATDSPVFR